MGRKEDLLFIASELRRLAASQYMNEETLWPFLSEAVRMGAFTEIRFTTLVRCFANHPVDAARWLAKNPPDSPVLDEKVAWRERHRVSLPFLADVIERAARRRSVDDARAVRQYEDLKLLWSEKLHRERESRAAMRQSPVPFLNARHNVAREASAPSAESMGTPKSPAQQPPTLRTSKAFTKHGIAFDPITRRIEYRQQSMVLSRRTANTFHSLLKSAPEPFEVVEPRKANLCKRLRAGDKAALVALANAIRPFGDRCYFIDLAALSNSAEEQPKEN